jgi:hypothetical protein
MLEDSMGDGAMAWLYSQSVGILTHNGQIIAIDYSRHGNGKNNPGMQQAQNVGSMPPRYFISQPRDSETVGPFALPLELVPETNPFGRSAFAIHEDGIVHPDPASEGSIIVLRYVRNMIGGSGDNELSVTA